ncbi:alpha/beta hydrolase [Acaryochloris sp. IP29b_bin.137]|uniref:alpha/beta hydrolase n=1 Tax=Acaryochloris sp. IP29b_bin.137 TaxID=2969217 RepID=UPI00261406DF|nr:alpha/beta hydrolase [Acaryochloris sp. IP29b_bin.137]
MNLNYQTILIGLFSGLRLLLTPFLIYVGFALYIFFKADSMIFLPQPSSYPDTDEVIKLPVTAKEQISALYLPNPNAMFTLLYIHGNAEDLGDIRPRLEQLQQSGFSVFAYDYRGYGTSDGQPSEQNAYEDVKQVYLYLTQTLGVNPNRLLVQGRSLGGGSAVYLATQYPVAGVILESTFTSTFRVVVPIPILPFDKFTNLQRLPQIHVPILVIHGEADSVIPIAQGRQLYAAASAPKQMLWVPSAGHNNVPQIAGERYYQALTAFQNLVLQQNPEPDLIEE